MSVSETTPEVTSAPELSDHANVTGSCWSSTRHVSAVSMPVKALRSTAVIAERRRGLFLMNKIKILGHGKTAIVPITTTLNGPK